MIKFVKLIMNIYGYTYNAHCEVVCLYYMEYYWDLWLHIILKSHELIVVIYSYYCLVEDPYNCLLYPLGKYDKNLTLVFLFGN